ncbi:MAG: hypothetical protein AMJ43_02775 [Coxiella sp. DG_40]|nr:MAG: hypothetical protein AMJ43_02775 [Coxiella sp. DG_40]
MFLFISLLVPLSLAKGAIYPMPTSGNDIIGHNETIYIEANDTLDKLAKEYEVSYHELLEANPEINPKNLIPGTKVLIPTQFILPKYRKGIVINIPELRLYYFMPDREHVFTTPVGLGRDSWRTPTMLTGVIKKEANPTWHVPKTILKHEAKNGHQIPNEVPPGDPDNPLGNYVLYLGGKGGYLIHGNNEPDTIGKYYSSGCIRLYNSAMETLYSMVAVGTLVRIIHDPDKVGWLNGELYLESHQSVSGNESDRDIQTQIQKLIEQQPINIDWNQVNLVNREKLGIPKLIGKE